jgi:SAM-dependent methyltransferase
MSEAGGECGTEFDRFAASYDEDLQRALSVSGEDKNYFSEGRMLWLARWLAKNGIKAAAVLDYGCGTGSATPFVFKHLGAARLVGSDVSEESLKVANAVHGGGAASFRMTGETCGEGFDVAFCNGVFHHITPDKRPAALNEIFASLGPGGVFAMFENNPWNPGTRYVMSRCAFDKDAMPLSPPEARRWMQAAGFRVLATRYLFVFPRALRLLRFLEPALSPLPLGAQYVIVGIKS